MTEKKPTTADILDRIRWPHVVLAGLILAATVALLVLLPEDRFGPLTHLLVTLLGGGGLAGTVARGGILRPADEVPPPRTIPKRVDPRRRNDGSTSMQAMAVAGVVLAWLLAIARQAVRWGWFGALLLVACGGATAEQRTAYAVEQARCLANERAIVDREGTSYELDRYDLEQERARCDAALHVIYQEAP
jgi:hypothetical protein